MDPHPIKVKESTTVTIDVERESQALAKRSFELAEMLEAAVPVVDRSPIKAALAESSRLAKEAHEARDQVTVRVAAGLDPGCLIGPPLPIRKVPSTPDGRDPDPVIKGRAVITPELVAYWVHRRDVVGPSIVSASERAAEALPTAPALTAAARGHLAVLRERANFGDEGGSTLDAALQRFDNARGTLVAGRNEGAWITSSAVERLELLQGEEAAGLLRGRGADLDSVQPWLAGRIVATLAEDVLIDMKTMKPLAGSELPPSPQPVTTARS
jgi:hypothetical protein